MVDGKVAMSNSVTLGLIGAGRMARPHAEGIADQVPGLDLVAAATRRRDAASCLSDRFGARALAFTELIPALRSRVSRGPQSSHLRCGGQRSIDAVSQPRS